MPANAQTEDPFRATDKDRIRKFEGQKLATEEKIANCGRPLRSFDETVRTALDFLGNINRLRASEHLEEKRILLKLQFGTNVFDEISHDLCLPCGLPSEPTKIPATSVGYPGVLPTAVVVTVSNA